MHMFDTFCRTYGVPEQQYLAGAAGDTQHVATLLCRRLFIYIHHHSASVSRADAGGRRSNTPATTRSSITNVAVGQYVRTTSVTVPAEVVVAASGETVVAEVVAATVIAESVPVAVVVLVPATCGDAKPKERSLAAGDVGAAGGAAGIATVFGLGVSTAARCVDALPRSTASDAKLEATRSPARSRTTTSPLAAGSSRSFVTVSVLLGNKMVRGGTVTD